MDKYHIYEEVGSGPHSQVFKGREKMDIEYVAIKRVEKSRMESVVNEVQVIHRLSSPNVLKFYDWYETRNNVWLILEFCTGGDLLTLIKQDHREPESSVRLFGVDLLAGLQQTHACGYLHGDLRPSNVLIDEYGILKLSGFGLARAVSSGTDEDGEQDKREFEGSGGDGGINRGVGGAISSPQQQQLLQNGSDLAKSAEAAMAEGRDPTYMAPELFALGEDAMSFASDFWSLGCVLYELLVGEPPFRPSASATVAEVIAREDPPGLEKGEWQGAQMSAPFRDLVGWLLDKKPHRRPTWPQLLAHPFWGNCQTPSPLEMPPQPRFDRGLAEAASPSASVAAGATAKSASDTGAAATSCPNVDATVDERVKGMHEASPSHQQRQKKMGKEEILVGGEVSLSSSAEGPDSVSTIDSCDPTGEREKSKAEWNGSFASAGELPGEVLEVEESPDLEGVERGGTREGGVEESGCRRDREHGGRTAKDVTSSTLAAVDADVGIGSSSWRKAGEIKEEETVANAGGEGSIVRPRPSRLTQVKSAAERRQRSTNQHIAPQEGQTVSPGDHPSRGQGLDHRRESGRPAESDQSGWGKPATSDGGKDVIFAAQIAGANVAMLGSQQQQRQQELQASAEPQIAPCHDGLVRSRRGSPGCGDDVFDHGSLHNDAAVAASATTTTIASENGLTGVFSRGERSSNRSRCVAGNSNREDDSPTSLADRAAAEEALNGLRLRGRIPPVRRGGGGRGRGGGLALAAGREGGGREGRSGRTEGKTCPLALSAASLVSVVSTTSSSIGEQYGSSFEEDTEGSSSCSGAGGGGAGDGNGSCGVPAVVTSVLPGGKSMTWSRVHGGGGGGGGDGGDSGGDSGGRGDQIAGNFVMASGSVGTETTATPSSTGITSLMLGGKEYSTGSTGNNGGSDKNGATSNKLLSVGSSSASVGSEASSAAGSTTTRGGGNVFAAAALSFRRAAGCYSAPASDRMSTSSWALSAGISSLRVSRDDDFDRGIRSSAADVRQGGTGSTSSRIPEVGMKQAGVVGVVHGETPPSPDRELVACATVADRSPSVIADDSGAGHGTWLDGRNRASGSPAVVKNERWTDEAQREPPPPPPTPPTPPPPPPPPPPLPASVVQGEAAIDGAYENDHGSYDSRSKREARQNCRGTNASSEGSGAQDVCAFRGDVDPEGVRSPVRRGLRELLLHTSDAQVTPIVGSRSLDSSVNQHRHQQTLGSTGITGTTLPQLCYSSAHVDQLPFEPLLPEVVGAMHPAQLEAHLTVTYNALTEASAPVRQKGQTLLYLQSLAPIPPVANLLVNSTFLVLLLRMLRKPRPAAIRDTVAALVGLLTRHATYIAPGAGRTPAQHSAGGRNGGRQAGQEGPRGVDRTGLEEAEPEGLMSALISTVRDRPAPGRAAQATSLRKNTMAALGELLFYIITQEPPTAPCHHGSGDNDEGEGGDRCHEDAWSIPVAAVGGVIRKCLLTTADAGAGPGVQYYAAKTLENVLAQVGPSHPLVYVLVTPELARGLLDLARHSSSENLRGTAAAGLFHLLGHDILGGECQQHTHVNNENDYDSCSSRKTGSHSSNKSGGGSGKMGLAQGRRGNVRNGVAGDIQAAGWIALQIMRQPGVPETIVQGLSGEGSLAPSRRAFLGIFILIVWASRNGGLGATGRWQEGTDEQQQQQDQQQEESGFFAPGEFSSCSSLRPAVEEMLDSQQLLLRLLRIAEHGEGAVLRAKGFLALRLALEVAGPAFLLKACRSRLLPVLARAIGGLAPRSTKSTHDPAAVAAAAAAAATGDGVACSSNAAVPELSQQQEYLYECSMQLADWLSAIPETAVRCLAAALRERHRYAALSTVVTATAGGGMTATRQDLGDAGHKQHQGRGASGEGGHSQRLGARQQAVSTLVTARTGRLEAAMATFPAVVHLVNSPLLRGRAVTASFVSNLSACLALSCSSALPAVEGKPDACESNRIKGSGFGNRSAGKGRFSPTDGWMSSNGVDGGASEAAVLSDILPAVETLAQQAELVLLPHRETVSMELIPVLCRLLRSPSGDTRALVVAIFRVLLPPLLRQHHPASPPLSLQHLGRRGGALSAGSPSKSPENMVRSAFTTHLRPLVAELLRDSSPIPQYTLRLLLDVGREWGGLGKALLADGGSTINSLLGTLPRPQPEGDSPFTSPRWRSRVTRCVHEPAEGVAVATAETAAALDPTLAALLTVLVERERVYSTDKAGDPGRRCYPRGPGVVGGGAERRDNTGGSTIFTTFLHHELPGRTAAAVGAAVEAEMPEALDALLGLAVALLDAGLLRRVGGVEETRSPSSNTGLQKSSRVVALATAAGDACGGRFFVGHGQVPGRTWEERQLETLLSAVPAVMEGVSLFCLEGGPGKRQQQQRQREKGVRRTPTRVREGAQGGRGRGGGIFVDEGVRSGVADSATLFLEMCYKLFGAGLLRTLLFFAPVQAIRGESGRGGDDSARASPSRATKEHGVCVVPVLPPTEATAAARHAQVYRQLADFLGYPDEDERPRMRVLRILLEAVSLLGLPFREALRQGPLWTALLRLATGRGGVNGGGRADYGGRATSLGGDGGREVVRGAGSWIRGSAFGGRGGKAVLGPTNALARDVVAAAREDRGFGGTDTGGGDNGGESCRSSSRGGARR